MPSTDGLRILVRGTTLDYGEWLEMLEARRSLLKPYLDSFTLRELGAIECLAYSSAQHHYGPLHLDSSKVMGDERFSLETQGIFYRPSSGVTHTSHSGYRAPPGGVSSPDGSMQIWGLTRSGYWILAEVQFQGLPGYKNRGSQKALSVDIQEANPARIVEKTKCTAQEIWEELGRAAKEWLKDRHRLYAQAGEIVHRVDMEERALSLLIRK